MFTFPREGTSDYSLPREVKFGDMTATPQERVRQFCAFVLPALEAAGYTGYGSQQRLVADTGMSSSSVSRLIKGEQIPHVKFFPALAAVTGLNPVELLVAAEILPREYLESQQTLSENNPSQVGSDPITPEEAAERLGIRGDMGKRMFAAMVDTLRQDDEDEADTSEGTAAQM